MVHSRHPVSRDKLRSFLANSSIFSIIFVFIALVTICAILNAVVLIGLSYGRYYAGQDVLVAELALDSFVAILGGEVSTRFLEMQFARQSLAVLKLLSVLLPTILLGAVVYKVLHPRRRLTIFRRTLNLCLKEERLEGSFYIATTLDVFDLSLSTYLRFYKPKLEDGRPNPYPLKTISMLADRYIPQPFSLVPTRVVIPVFIAKTHAELMAYPDSKRLAILVEGGQITGARIDEQTIFTERDEFCEILVIVAGKIPKAQTHLLEAENFGLISGVTIGATPVFDAYFERTQSRYLVRNWHDFDA